MKNGVLEQQLIVHCAPTLAGMKSANLFNFFHEDKEHVRHEMCRINDMLNPKGVYVEELLHRGDSMLLYAYRPKQLQKELQLEGVEPLLLEHGYPSTEVRACIDHLKARLIGYTCFPHEIGLFLGYPLEDVLGFIENKGQNCKTCGLWKVYCNEAEKEAHFLKLKRCTEVYLKVFAEGRSLGQMIVSA